MSMISTTKVVKTINYSQLRVYNLVYHDTTIIKIMLQILLYYNLNSIEPVLNYNHITSLNQLSSWIEEKVVHD